MRLLYRSNDYTNVCMPQGIIHWSSPSGSIESLWDNKSKVVFDQVHVETTTVRFHRPQSFRWLTNSCHVSYTKRPMPRGTMLRAAMERDGSGSTLFDSHQVGARWAGDQPQACGCGYLRYLRIERRQLYHVQSLGNPVRQWDVETRQLFQQVGACSRSGGATCGKGKVRADKVGIRYFTVTGRQFAPGSVAIPRKNWGLWKRDFNWSIQNVIPHICELQCGTSGTWWETVGIGKVIGDDRNPGSICRWCKYMAGLADASGCSIDPPDPWQWCVWWRFRGTKSQLQLLGFQVSLYPGRSRLPAGQHHFSHSVGRGWGRYLWAWPPIIPNGARPARGSRGRLYFQRIRDWNPRVFAPHPGCQQHPVQTWPTGHSRDWRWRAQLAGRSPGCEDRGCFRICCRNLRSSIVQWVEVQFRCFQK